MSSFSGKLSVVEKWHAIFLPEFHDKRHARTLADETRATAFRQCLTLVSLFACLLESQGDISFYLGS